MDKYSFKKHTQVGGRFEDRITVTHSRSIGFPTQFYNVNNVDNYKYVVLFYDKINNAIGIKFAEESEIGAIKIGKHNKGFGGAVAATSFFKANRINTKRYAGKYEYKKVALRDLDIDENGWMYVIELKAKEGGEYEADG